MGFLAAGDAPAAFVEFLKGRCALGYDLGVQTRRDLCRVDPGEPWRDRKTADALGIVVPFSPPRRADEVIP